MVTIRRGGHLDRIASNLPPIGPMIDDTKLNKSQKFVRVLELLQRHEGVTASELMSRFQLDDRTLRRYLSDLRDIDLDSLDMYMKNTFEP